MKFKVGDRVAWSNRLSSTGTVVETDSGYTSPVMIMVLWDHSPPRTYPYPPDFLILLCDPVDILKEML